MRRLGGTGSAPSLPPPWPQCNLGIQYPGLVSAVRRCPALTMRDEILNIREVAEQLRVAEKTLSMTQCGELPTFNMCLQWRLRRADLDAWSNTQRAPARERPRK